MRHYLGIHPYLIIRDTLEGVMNYCAAVLVY
jgi:hypothetical protein